VARPQGVDLYKLLGSEMLPAAAGALLSLYVAYKK